MRRISNDEKMGMESERTLWKKKEEKRRTDRMSKKRTKKFHLGN
jgi:hypothetical protein